MSATVDLRACAGCGLCADLCPYGAVRMEGRRPHISAEDCRSCGLCVSSCPRCALDLMACSRATVRKGVWRAAVSSGRPRCLIFACDKCGREELARGLRAAGLRNVRLVRVPCTARVDLLEVAEALASGVDVVVVVGCEPGECEHGDAFLHAEVRLRLARSALGVVGLEDVLFHMRSSPSSTPSVISKIVEIAGGGG